MQENILNLIMQAEKEYHLEVKNAAREAQKYADDCKERQSDYMEELKQEWHLFEERESVNFKKLLSEKKQEIDAQIAKQKERLRICQSKKADLISERLKKEVLSLNGNS